MVRTLTVMRKAGCSPLLVVIGAAAAEVRELLPPDVVVIEAPDWSSGLAASLRAGLAAAARFPCDVNALMVMLVDLPGVTAEMLAVMHASGQSTRVLARGRYDGSPGHPVLLGRAHWAGVAAAAVGDGGALPYLLAHGVVELDLGTAADGADVDIPVRGRDVPCGSPSSPG